MVPGSRPTRLTGSALVRLLARWADADAFDAKQSVAERLSRWLGWTDAVALSAALNSRSSTEPSSGPKTSVSREESEFVRVRAALAQAMADDGAFVDDVEPLTVQALKRGAPAAAPPTGFARYRRQYLAKQQAMEASIEPLRGRLRLALAAKSPDMARLAAVDAVMEQALDPHEHVLLSNVPALLEKHFGRLRQAAEAAASSESNAEAQAEAWEVAFRQDMRAVLLAELDVRFQPVEGLLEALRAKQAEPQ